MKLRERDFAKLICAAASGKSNVKVLAQELWHSMYQNKALSKIDRIFDLAYELYAENNGSVIVSVSSAVELADSQKNEIERELKHRLEKEIIAHYMVDSTLGTGVRIIAKDKLIDLSSKNQIERLNNHLKG